MKVGRGGGVSIYTYTYTQNCLCVYAYVALSTVGHHNCKRYTDGIISGSVWLLDLVGLAVANQHRQRFIV